MFNEATMTMDVPKLDSRFARDIRVEPSGALETQVAEKFLAARQKFHERFQDPAFDLPMMPTCVGKVLTLCESPEESPRAIQQALQLDPALTAKILRVANSPMYGGARHIDSLQTAITRLGVGNIRNVVLAAAVNTAIRSARNLGNTASLLWEHAIAAGIAAQALAKRVKLPEQTAFVLGLMHDIGKLPAWLMLNELVPAGAPVRKAMLETLIEDSHCEIGEALIDAWEMPFDVRTVAGWHHSVTSLNALYGHITVTQPHLSPLDAKALAELVCCVVLADRALGALKLSQESCVFQIGAATLSSDIGLSVEDSLAYLMELPDILKKNDFRNL